MHPSSLEMLHTLCNISIDTGNEHGFLAFLRLVGSTYYKKNATAFNESSPESHFKSLQAKAKSDQASKSPLDVHSEWLEDIRQAVLDRINMENDMVPSVDALWRHWKRSCWVADMWGQADQNTMNVKDVSLYGWSVKDGTISVDWDSGDNLEKVQRRIQLLTKGCKCKAGCGSLRCSCKKKAQHCSEGCSCLHCSNLPQTSDLDMGGRKDRESEPGDTESESESGLESDMEEFIDNVFGMTFEDSSDSDA